MSVETFELLTGLREICQVSDFTDDDGAMDLGERLVEIQSIAEDLLGKAGWSLPDKDTDEKTARCKVEVEYDLNYWGGDYDGVGDTETIFIDLPRRTNEDYDQERIEHEFLAKTKIDPRHIIHYEVTEDPWAVQMTSEIDAEVFEPYDSEDEAYEAVKRLTEQTKRPENFPDIERTFRVGYLSEFEND